MAYHPNFDKHDINYYNGTENFQNGHDHHFKNGTGTGKNEVTYKKRLTYLDDAHAAKTLRKRNPHVKLILMTCDPIRRSYLDFSDVLRSKLIPFEKIWQNYYPEGYIEDDKVKVPKFQKLVDDSLEKIEKQKEILRGDQFVRWIRHIYTHSPELSVVTNSLYMLHLKEWLKIGFKKDQIMIINGDELRKHPAEIISEVQDFMKLEKVIKEENFVRKKERSPIICFQRDKKTKKDCSIFTPRSNSPVYPMDLIKKLNSFFKPYNDQLLDLTGEDLGVNLQKRNFTELEEESIRNRLKKIHFGKK